MRKRVEGIKEGLEARDEMERIELSEDQIDIDNSRLCIHDGRAIAWFIRQ